MDDFLLHALLGGIGVALAAGPLGSFIVWRRMAYFGDTLAHSGLLGVGLGILLGLNQSLGVVVVCAVLAVVLVLLQRQRRLATDTLLGILSHTALSLGLVALAFLETVRVDLVSYLFGDILAVTRQDLYWIWGGGLLALAALAFALASLVGDDRARRAGPSGRRGGVPGAAGVYVADRGSDRGGYESSRYIIDHFVADHPGSDRSTFRS